MSNSEIVEKKTEPVEETYHYRINPTHYLRYDGETRDWDLEVHLPGVAKEHVKFKVLPDAFFLEATRDKAIYELSEYFPFEIDVGSVKGKYENGLLSITGKIKDAMDDATAIKIA